MRELLLQDGIPLHTEHHLIIPVQQLPSSRLSTVTLFIFEYSIGCAGPHINPTRAIIGKV